MRFTTMKELGELIPVGSTMDSFAVSQEELDIYSDLLIRDTVAAANPIMRGHRDLLFRGIRLTINANN